MTTAHRTIQTFLQRLNIDAIKSICKPLEEHFGLTSFVYRKNYYDGSEIILTNQPEWAAHYYANQELMQQGTFDKHPDTYKSGFVLWSQLQGHQLILQHARQFNIDHGVTIVKKVTDGIELYFFGTTSDRPEIVNYYLNNMDLLERFILYFKDQAADLIKLANKYRLVVFPDKFEQVKIVESDLKAIKPMMTREQFIEATRLKQYHLDGEFKGVVLSAREIDVISCLLQGMTSEETGNTIHLSARTVEDYLAAIRNKFGVKSKSKLVQKLLQSDFISYIPFDFLSS